MMKINRFLSQDNNDNENSNFRQRDKNLSYNYNYTIPACDGQTAKRLSAAKTVHASCFYI